MADGDLSDEDLAMIGKNVRELRRACRPRVTQDDLARRTGLHRNTIIGIEKGKQKDLRISTLLAVARALRVTPNDITGFTLEPTVVDRLVDEYLKSPEAKRTKPTAEEIADLRAIDDIERLGAEPSPTVIDVLLKVLRGKREESRACQAQSWR